MARGWFDQACGGPFANGSVKSGDDGASSPGSANSATGCATCDGTLNVTGAGTGATAAAAQHWPTHEQRFVVSPFGAVPW